MPFSVAVFVVPFLMSVGAVVVVVARPSTTVDRWVTTALHACIPTLDVECWNWQANKRRRRSMYRLLAAFALLIFLLPMHGLWLLLSTSFRFESLLPGVVASYLVDRPLAYPGAKNEYELWRYAVLCWQLLFTIQFVAIEIPEFFHELKVECTETVVRAVSLLTVGGLATCAFICWGATVHDPRHHLLAESSLTAFELVTNIGFCVAYRRRANIQQSNAFVSYAVVNTFVLVSLAVVLAWSNLGNGHHNEWLSPFVSGFSAALLLLGTSVFAVAWLFATYIRICSRPNDLQCVPI